MGVEVGGKATSVAIAIEGNQTEVTPTTLPASRRLSALDRRLPGTRRKGNAEGSPCSSGEEASLWRIRLLITHPWVLRVPGTSPNVGVLLGHFWLGGDNR